ncbi:MAG TPA: hypothetical protein VLF41_02240 [Candidatus Nanoarchaeia archaeon]|nr:hypothetical protein [Candidatus Nanoarchaeia archaeon]
MSEYYLVSASFPCTSAEAADRLARRLRGRTHQVRVTPKVPTTHSRVLYVARFPEEAVSKADFERCAHSLGYRPKNYGPRLFNRLLRNAIGLGLHWYELADGSQQAIAGSSLRQLATHPHHLLATEHFGQSAVDFLSMAFGNG